MIRIYLIILFISALLNFVNGQDKTPPSRPFITYVTVDTANNNVNIYWDKSTSADVEWYLLYYEIETVNGFEGVKFDSVSADQSGFVHINGASGNNYMLYSVTARDSAGNESIRKPGLHSTIYCSVKYDSCENRMQINWNKYIGWGNDVSGYRIYWRTGSEPFQILTGTTSEDSTHFHYGIMPNTRYEYFIEAVKNDGLISRSNIYSKYTYMPTGPHQLAIDYVTISEMNVAEISFTFTDTTGIDKYGLFRSSDKNADYLRINSAENISGNNYLFRDETIISSSDHYYYKIGAINTCDVTVAESNTGTNILLNISLTDDEVILNWTGYETWPEGIEEYQIFQMNAEKNMDMIGTSQSTSFTDYLPDSYNTGITGDLTYLVRAKRINEDIFSVSNIAKINSESMIFVPNAFTPNGDGKNDIFRPVISFIPNAYKMIIYDRYGIKVYSTENPTEGWNGEVSGGQMATEGVYVYHIQFSSFNGINKEKTGHVTVFYP